jgi:hypothetical protein
MSAVNNGRKYAFRGRNTERQNQADSSSLSGSDNGIETLQTIGTCIDGRGRTTPALEMDA